MRIESNHQISRRSTSWRLLPIIGAVILAAGAGAGPRNAAVPPAKTPVHNRLVSLTVSPARVVLDGPYAEVRLMIDGTSADGTIRDISRQSAAVIRDPEV